MTKKRRNVRSTRVAQPNAMLREVDYIVRRARQCDTRVVSLDQLVFFSTATGDAWMLDPEDGLALQLAEAGERKPAKIVETPTRYAVEWTASYSLDGDVFVTVDGSGARAILGYPVRELALAAQRIARWHAL